MKNVYAILCKKLSFLMLLGLLTCSFNGWAQPTWLSSSVSSNDGNGSSNNPTFNRPANVQAGDLLLVAITTEKGSETGYNAPTGWTVIETTNNSNHVGLRTYYKIAGVSEPNTYTFNRTGSSGKFTASISHFRGVDTSNPIGESSGNTGNSRTHTSTSITSEANSMIVSLHTNNNTSTVSLSNVSGTTERFLYRNNNNAYYAQLMATFTMASAGATGNRAVTHGGSNRRFATQQIELREAASCPVSINAGSTTTSSATVCSGVNFTLGLSGQTSNALIAYQWQQAVVGTSNWENITGATESSLVQSANASMQYRCKQSCDALESFSTPVTVTLDSFLNCYCTPTATTDDATGITRVVFNSIDNSSTGDAAYTDFTAISTAVNKGLSYNLSVSVNTDGNYNTRTFAWVDWNQNGVFEEEEAYSMGVVLNQANGLTPNSPLEIVVPENAVLGTTRMRIRTFYVAPANVNDANILSPCENSNWSEAEDYTIVVESIPTQTWTGAVNSQWNNAGNWSGNAVPNAVTPVIIPATSNQPLVSGSTVRVAGSIEVQTGAVLTISSNSGLEVTNEITVAEGGEFIVSDKANLGQVNPNAVNTGIVKVRRNTMELSRLDYVLWSSPTHGTQTLKQFSPQTVDNRFYIYNSATNQYNTVSSVHTPFESGKGYLIRTPNNHSEAPTVWSTEYQGTPNNGTIVQQMPAPRSGTQNRFFLVGNPYASAIKIQEFLDANEDNITGITYIWRKTNGTNISAYGILNRNPNGTLNFTSNGKAQNPGDCIVSGQGFIVEMKEGASQVVFTNAMRTCNGFGVMNRLMPEAHSSLESDELNLKLTQANGQFTFASLGYYANASNDFEDSYDAQAMSDGTLSLATQLEDRRLATQARASFIASDIVPLSIITPAAGTYEIAIDQMSGIFQNQVVYLEDALNNTRHNLSVAPFTENLEGGTHENRFRLVYQNQLLSVEIPEMNNDDFQIAVQQQTVSVRTSANIGISTVTVMNIQGKIIAQTRAEGATETSVYVPQIKNQAALVKIEAENGTVTYRKIMF